MRKVTCSYRLAHILCRLHTSEGACAVQFYSDVHFLYVAVETHTKCLIMLVSARKRFLYTFNIPLQSHSWIQLSQGVEHRNEPSIFPEEAFVTAMTCKYYVNISTQSDVNFVVSLFLFLFLFFYCSSENTGGQNLEKF